jgi:hypothetical protein
MSVMLIAMSNELFHLVSGWGSVGFTQRGGHNFFGFAEKIMSPPRMGWHATAYAFSPVQAVRATGKSR